MTGYQKAEARLLEENGVERSTIMKHDCLRYNGAFMAMMFVKENGLVIKVSPDRVTELIANGIGSAFNLTGKTFKEWVLISEQHHEHFEALLFESLNYLKSKE